MPELDEEPQPADFLIFPAAGEAYSPMGYMPKMTPVPVIEHNQRCDAEDIAFGQCQLPPTPPHTMHRVDWDGYQARWNTGAPEQPSWYGAIIHPV